MYLAGQPGGFGATDIYSVSLATGAPLSTTGWKFTRGTTGGVGASRGTSFAVFHSLDMLAIDNPP